MQNGEIKATYVTPQNPGMSIINAMAEIRAKEASTHVFMSDTEQAQIILEHLRDYFGGKVLVMQFRNMLSIKTLVSLLCDTEECKDEMRDLVNGRAA